MYDKTDAKIEGLFDIPQQQYHTRKARITIEFEWTPGYCWYLIPTVEINTSVKEVALNIFCLGIYFGWAKP